ncbi:MAG: ATP-dependent helicase [Candidatus Berkelbacteria bacterium]|nr:MAG: ATP-dependent helicase [Candidatus Berkelbacteria bacterium]QQG51419.1 MAG: ATP-dependent helicase [Candidatus Berkelbacteria bacterium]
MNTAKKNQVFEREFARLNPAQKKAVRTIEGPVMVVAGPGTGKTQVVAMRIAEILNQTQLNARNILALTFTEAGVTALRSRLEKIIGSDAYQVTVATFHGFANEVITTFPYVFGFAVEAMQVGELERLQIIHRIVEHDTSLIALRPVRAPTFHVPSIAEAIRKAKQENVLPETLAQLARKEAKSKLTAKRITELQRQAIKRAEALNVELSRVYAAYQKELKRRNLYDYEDMIIFAVQGLQEEADVIAYYQERFQYFLVDEYQDTNNAQNSLVESLAEFFPNPNLCVVGDDKQAIYRFQGASVANMLRFVRKYPALKVISLTENYRSAKRILDASTALINRNNYQLTRFLPELKTILSPTRSNDKSELKLINTASAEAQYAWIVAQIKKRFDKNLPPQEVAVLLRRNDEVKSFREFAAKSGISVAGVESTNLMNEPDVRQIVGLLRAINDMSDPIYVAPALNLITTLSPIVLARLARAFHETKSWQKAIDFLALSAKENKTLRAALETLGNYQQRVRMLSLPEFFEEIISSSRILKEVSQQRDALERLEIIKAFINEAKRFSIQNPGSGLEEFLDYIDLLRQYRVRLPVHRLGPKVEGVFVNTVHGAKGLEFDTVFLPNVSTKSWNDRGKRELIKLPGSIVNLDDWDESPIEDERRLFYVAMTRAKNQLYLSYSKYDEEGREVLPSQFVSEVESHLERESYEPSVSQANEILTTAITPNQAVFVRNEEKKVIRELIREKPFTFTDYETYKTCPKQYLLKSVLRFPSRPDPRLIYGDILHRALELFYKQFRTRKTLPTKTALLNYCEQASRHFEFFRGKTAIITQAKNLLEEYYLHVKTKDELPPVGVEYSFASHHVMLDSIWVSGKYDRLDIIDPLARTVKVVDYKTGAQAKTRSQIEGQTKSSDGKLKEQLVFYALLAREDRHFPYHAAEFALKFLDDKHTFREEPFRITNDEIDSLAKDVKETYEKILAADTFIHARDSFDQGCELCEIFSELS